MIRLLLVTYELDDHGAVLAWQAQVVRELAKYCEHIHVLTERLGNFNCPKNVSTERVPTVRGLSPVRIFLPLFWSYAAARAVYEYNLNSCFVHMAHRWVYRLHPILRINSIPILLWYAHGSTRNLLSLSEWCATRIVTSSAEGFKLVSSKLRIIGQGVNTQLFHSIQPEYGNDIVYLGRVSRRKRLHLLIESMAALKRRFGSDVPQLAVWGEPLSEDDLAYRGELDAKINQLNVSDVVKFRGSVANVDAPSIYESAFLHLSCSDTGSIDKSLLEALSSGCPILTSVEALRPLLAQYPEFLIDSIQSDHIAEKIMYIFQRRGLYRREQLRGLILGHHDLNSYAQKLNQNLLDMVK